VEVVVHKVGKSFASLFRCEKMPVEFLEQQPEEAVVVWQQLF
jgi:hypothetical protein